MKYNILDNTMIHGGDYNPDQWLDYPEVLAEDIRLMKLAHVNCVSLAIFAWATLEPQEGVYEFDWLEQIINNLYEHDIYTMLATPTGARPLWMAEKYEEVLRVNKYMQRQLFGERHNHCYTSPVFREKTQQMNTRLAKRFGNHPGVIMWHISNEYGGECYCPHCQAEFRKWLEEKYKTIDALNHAWWTRFWSHTYTGFDQVMPPSPIGEQNVHGLNIDWKRFVTDRTVDFLNWEVKAVRDAGSDLPVTINAFHQLEGLNYFKFKDAVDMMSYDAYPLWHKNEDEIEQATETAFIYDLIRSVKKKPFLLMESVPSAVNWQPAAKVKRPGMHMLSSMQAIAHGSNSVQYFQWRKSRGSSEKFHGAVVDHYGKEDTRVFRDVADLGSRLEKLGELCATCQKPEVALIYDWENAWAYRDAAGPHRPNDFYLETVLEHYRAFWKQGVPVDVVDMEQDFEGYKLVVAPMLYMYRAGIEGKLRKFVENGGTLIGTYWSGIVDETDLCFLGGMPGGGMREVFGVRSEEIDGLHEHDYNSMAWQGKTYRLRRLCDQVRAEGAETLAVYHQDFYAGNPCLLKNTYGSGMAYYLGADAIDGFYDDFYKKLAGDIELAPALPAELPEGVTATLRKGEKNIAVVQNYNNKPVDITLTETVREFETDKPLTGKVQLRAYEVMLLLV